MSFVAYAYPSSPDSLTRVVLGLVLLRSTRAIDLRDLARFAHLSSGDMYPRPQSGLKYMYENGAFRLFKGVAQLSLFHRCKEHAAYVDGRICRLDKIHPRTDESNIFGAVDLISYPIMSQQCFSESRDAARCEFTHGGIHKRPVTMRP